MAVGPMTPGMKLKSLIEHCWVLGNEQDMRCVECSRSACPILKMAPNAESLFRQRHEEIQETLSWLSEFLAKWSGDQQ